MEYIKGVAGQTEIFMYSLGFGFLLGILYDVFRTLRLIMPKAKAFVVCTDMIYFVLVAFAVFFFALAFDCGRLSFYLLTGLVFGWFIYYFSFGTVTVRVTSAILGIIRGAFSAVLKPFVCLGKLVSKIFLKILINFKKITRKSYKKVKINLQKHRGIVYNLFSYIKNKNNTEKE